jgi:hypothetical protein
MLYFGTEKLVGKEHDKNLPTTSETWEVMRDYKIGELAESEST